MFNTVVPQRIVSDILHRTCFSNQTLTRILGHCPNFGIASRLQNCDTFPWHLQVGLVCSIPVLTAEKPLPLQIQLQLQPKYTPLGVRKHGVYGQMLALGPQ